MDVGVLRVWASPLQAERLSLRYWESLRQGASDSHAASPLLHQRTRPFPNVHWSAASTLRPPPQNKTNDPHTTASPMPTSAVVVSPLQT